MKELKRKPKGKPDKNYKDSTISTIKGETQRSKKE